MSGPMAVHVILHVTHHAQSHVGQHFQLLGTFRQAGCQASWLHM